MYFRPPCATPISSLTMALICLEPVEQLAIEMVCSRQSTSNIRRLAIAKQRPNVTFQLPHTSATHTHTHTYICRRTKVYGSELCCLAIHYLPFSLSLLVLFLSPLPFSIPAGPPMLALQFPPSPLLSAPVVVTADAIVNVVEVFVEKIRTCCICCCTS